MANLKKILGVDYSINCPSVCYFDGQDVFWYVNYRREGKTYPVIDGRITMVHSKTSNELDRIVELSSWLLSIVRYIEPDQIVFEDYAFGARGSSLTHLAENAGHAKAMLTKDAPHVPLHLLAPTKMKKFATGKGTANKDAIWAAFVKLYPEADAWQKLCHPKAKSVESPCGDIADSYFLAMYGKEIL